MAHLKTQMDLLTKHLLSDKTEIVKAVGAHGHDESEGEEEANYVYNQGVFEAVAKETKFRTSTKKAKEIKVEITTRSQATGITTRRIGRTKATRVVCASLSEIDRLLQLALGRCPWRICLLNL